MTKSNLQPKYLAALTRLEATHPHAFRFLRKLAEGHDDLWLSTDTNAHLYKGNAFLMYIKLHGRERSSSIRLSPTFNQRIMDGAIDRSALIFPKAIEKLVMAHRGFSTRWATKLAGSEVEITALAPEPFFEQLLALVQGLAVNDD